VISSAAWLKNVTRQSRSTVKTPSAMLFRMISVWVGNWDAGPVLARFRSESLLVGLS